MSIRQSCGKTIEIVDTSEDKEDDDFASRTVNDYPFYAIDQNGIVYIGTIKLKLAAANVGVTEMLLKLYLMLNRNHYYIN